MNVTRVRNALVCVVLLVGSVSCYPDAQGPRNGEAAGLPVCGTYTTRDQDGLCICIEQTDWCIPDDPNDLNCCPNNAWCGDRVCTGEETPTTCPADCSATSTDACGDGRCSGAESPTNCPTDCESTPPDMCGDGRCVAPETRTNCPADCDTLPADMCGDGRCVAPETRTNCPADCDTLPTDTCGDRTCTYGEIYDCDVDCGDAFYCGDGVCLTAEAFNGCTEDCALGESVTDYDMPDVLLVLVSGHCFSDCPGGVNWEYLYEQGTADEIAWVFERHDLVVDLLVYSDSFYDHSETGRSYLPTEGRNIVEGYGFLTMLRELAEVRDRWVIDNPNPPAIIVVAHSHGNVWAAMAMHLLIDVPIDVWVSLDAVSIGWEDDSSTLLLGDRWTDIILDYSVTYGIVWPWSVWQPTSAWRVGDAITDIKDLVPSNVKINLEVAGTQLVSPITDDEPNIRLNGTVTGIISVQMDEAHEDVDNADSDSIAWVVEMLGEIYEL